MISVDESLIVQIINFVFLIWILNLILYKPIRRVVLQRKEKISGLEKSIESFIRDAREKDDSLSLGIEASREKGLRKKEDMLESAAEHEKKIIQTINERAQADLAAVREKIEKDAEDVRRSLQKEIDEFATAIGQKILGRAVE